LGAVNIPAVALLSAHYQWSLLYRELGMFDGIRSVKRPAARSRVAEMSGLPAIALDHLRHAFAQPATERFLGEYDGAAGRHQIDFLPVFFVHVKSLVWFDQNKHTFGLHVAACLRWPIGRWKFPRGATLPMTGKGISW
jgi:hypothetical protein